jgi:hypothetical protein
VVKIEIKIAGVISTMDNIHDIENLAKLFVMEHRINNLQCCKETKKIIGETHLEFTQKSTVFSNFIHGKLPILTVKGLE